MIVNIDKESSVTGYSYTDRHNDTVSCEVWGLQINVKDSGHGSDPRLELSVEEARKLITCLQRTIKIIEENEDDEF